MSYGLIVPLYVFFYLLYIFCSVSKAIELIYLLVLLKRPPPTKHYFIKYFKFLNHLGFGLCIGFMADKILVSQFGKKFNDNRITMPQTVAYITPMIISVFSLIFFKNSLI